METVKRILDLFFSYLYDQPVHFLHTGEIDSAIIKNSEVYANNRDIMKKDPTKLARPLQRLENERYPEYDTDRPPVKHQQISTAIMNRL